MSQNNFPVDTYYYDVLNIPTNADYLTIKRTYKKLALKYHPDKNKSPESEKKFKEISEAYQILGDDKLRNQYDSHGRDNIQMEEGFVDARIQFQNMYGGNSFRSIFGPLNLPMFLSQDDQYYQKGEYPPTATNSKAREVFMTELEQQQEEKVNELVTHLKDKLLVLYDPHSNDDNKKLRDALQTQCKQLKHESYGDSFLLIVGRMYTIQAKRHLGMKNGGGWSMPGVYYSLKDKKHNTKELWKSVKINMEAHKVAELLHAAEKKDNGTCNKKSEDIQELEDLYITLCYRALFQMVKFEVEATLRLVCQKLLNDKSANPDELNRRANGLQLIGNTYISHSEISEMENSIVLLLDK